MRNLLPGTRVRLINDTYRTSEEGVLVSAPTASNIITIRRDDGTLYRTEGRLEIVGWE